MVIQRSSSQPPLPACASRQRWERENGGVGCWWAHYCGLWLSGRLRGDFHLTALTAESGLMGSAVQRVEEENPCVQIFYPSQQFPPPSLTYFLPLPTSLQIPWSKSRETQNYFENEELLIFHADRCSSGCISLSVVSFSRQMHIDWYQSQHSLLFSVFLNLWRDGGSQEKECLCYSFDLLGHHIPFLLGSFRV